MGNYTLVILGLTKLLGELKECGVEGDKRDHGTHEELREVATVTDEVKAEETQD